MSAAETAAATRTSQDVRVANTALVLRALRDGGPASRAALASRTGLTKGTVGTIVTRLEEDGVVHAPLAPSPDGVRGRPSRPVSLQGTPLVGLGVEVNVDYRAAVALDLGGDVRLHLEERHGRRPDQPVDVDEVGRFIASSLDRLAAEGLRPLGVSIAVPGLVCRDGRTVEEAPNLGWHGVDLASAVEPALTAAGPLPVPVRVENDAGCAARAESTVGAAPGATHLLYVTGTVGVGGGVLAGGDVLQGRQGFAGEVGHLHLGDDAHRCACGRTGCWETAVGLRALQRLVGIRDDPDADPIGIARAVAARAEDADPVVLEGLAVLAEDLARGCVLLATLLDPGTIVVGGYFATLAPWLLPAVRDAIGTGLPAGRCDVVPSTLGLQAAATGAAAQVVADVHAGRLPLP